MRDDHGHASPAGYRGWHSVQHVHHLEALWQQWHKKCVNRTALRQQWHERCFVEVQVLQGGEARVCRKCRSRTAPGQQWRQGSCVLLPGQAGRGPSASWPVQVQSHLVSLEWGFPSQHGKQHHSQAPDISCHGVRLLLGNLCSIALKVSLCVP